MNKPATFLVVTCLAVLPLAVSAEERHEQDKIRELVKGGTILPLEQIIDKAKAEHPGKLIEAELDDEDGRFVYEVEIVDAAGKVTELHYDAANAELLKTEREDD